MCLRHLPFEEFGPLCDATLQAVAWVDGGPDMPPPLVLTLRLSNHTVVAYTFTWVSHLKVSLVQEARGLCQPFTWSTEARRLEDGRLAITFDFAGNGEIAFQCEDIRIPGT